MILGLIQGFDEIVNKTINLMSNKVSLKNIETLSFDAPIITFVDFMVMES